MTFTPRRRRLLGGLGVAVAVLTAGCTGDGDAPAPASSAVTPTSAAPAPARPSTSGAASSPVQPPPSASTAATTAPRSTVVAAAGDIACDPGHAAFNDGRGTATECQQLATSDLVLAMDPAAVLALGDLQYEVGRLAAFKGSYDLSWGRFKDITYPAAGNHEYGTGVTRGYFEYFGARAAKARNGYYSADIGDWHLVVLNSNCAQIDGCQRGSPQEKWLRADLAANRARCTIAVMHHPRWTSGLHGNSEKVDGLWRALVAGGADVALAGHDHHYERFAPLDASGAVDEQRGMRQFIVGTGGRNLYPAFGRAEGSEVRNSQTFGVLKLTLEPTAYQWEFVPVPGRSFTDSGSGSCH